MKPLKAFRPGIDLNIFGWTIGAAFSDFGDGSFFLYIYLHPGKP
jgi:hypothetical protein